MCGLLMTALDDGLKPSGCSWRSGRWRKWLLDCLIREDLVKRHPSADRFLVDHVVELESFFDRSVMSGMSYGLEKACLAVTEGSLLGHRVGTDGLSGFR